VDHLGLLEGEVLAMKQALLHIDPATPVPACPGWTLRELTGHLMGVHRWVRNALDSDGPPLYDEPVLEGDLSEAYFDASQDMVARLRELPASHPCWTFDRGNRTAGFWIRRQLHEVAMHRYDVAPYAQTDEVALDGIDEVMTFFAPRQVSAGRTTLPDGRLVVATGEHQWTLGHGDTVALVTGAPQQVLLQLWGRGAALPEGWSALTP
jgi:uncharacterized protein (TIGR03083 family)